jgi:PAS domain S-box-containing protein
MSSGKDGDVSSVGERHAFQEAVENTGHAIYWTDRTGSIEYVNPAFEAQTGYSAEEAIGNNANLLQSGVHGDLFYEQLWDTILNGDVWEGEIINERKDGERYVVKQTISPVTDDTGTITRFVAVNEDVTDLREYQERLERQRDRVAGLFDAVPAPLVLAEFDGDDLVVKQTNAAFSETFGYSAKELGGSVLDKFIVDDERSAEAGDLNTRVRQGEQIRQEVTRRTATGERRTFLLSATRLGTDAAEVLATYIDVTDQKRAQEQLKERTEDLEEFANVVSHDLRNPLNVAAGHLELLDEACDSPHVDTIREAHTRMQELIENILMLAKHGKSIGETGSVSLDACVSKAWETVETGSASLTVAASNTVQADESRLRQLFANLVRNAVEHGGERVTVTVGDLRDGFYIADTGPGIPEEKRSDVFDAGHTTTENGTGFGLAIVQEIADAHGWTITVTDSESGGARFEITGVTFAAN